MAVVPYTGAPSVSPQNQPIPREWTFAPPAAFGGDTAQAEQKLGGAFAQSGNELFSRAMAMQQLANSSEAQEAISNYIIQASKIHANLSAMQGKDAVNYFNGQYAPDLHNARESIRNGLSNPMVQKLYDADSRSFEARTIFNGAGHSAHENTSYAIGAAASRVSAARNAALVDPTDEAGFQQHVQDTIQNVNAQWQLKGADQDTIDNAQHTAVSNLYRDRVTALARTQPFTAEKIFNQAVKDGKINGDDIGRLTSIVRDATHTVGARNISNNLVSGQDTSWGAKPVSISQAKLAIGTNESTNNYNTVVDTGTAQGRALGRYGITEANLPSWLKQSGLPPMTPEAFVKDQGAQDKVFETVFGGYMQKYGSFNDAASAWLTGKPLAEAGNATDRFGTNAQKYIAKANSVLAKNAPLADLVARGRDQADQFSPNDPLLADYTEQRIVTDHNLQLAVKRDDDYGNRQTVEQALVGGTQGGKLPMSIDDLKTDPKVATSWSYLAQNDPAAIQRYMNVIAHNAKGDVPWTSQRLTEYQQLKGEAQSDPSAFMDENIVGADLPLSARKELVNLQVAKKAKSEADPRVLHALSILKPTMDQAGISRTSDLQSYDRFVGALQGAMEQHADIYKKSPNEKEIMEMGQRLLQGQVGTGFFGSNIDKTPLYNVEVPEAEKTKILADPYWKSHGIVPTNDMVQRIYTRQLYNKLYSGTPKAASVSNQPSVPVSK
jgi:hypothetical protein